MPRKLDSVDRGGYVEPVDPSASELDSVLEMLDLGDSERLETARNQLLVALEDLASARSHSFTAKPVREDLKELKELADVLNKERVTRSLQHAIGALESLETTNPVLYQRVKDQFSEPRLRERLAALVEAEEQIYVAMREIGTGLTALEEEIRREDGRGRPADRAAMKFASTLYEIWVGFTGRKTTRLNASDRPSHPFGDFVDAAGKLIEPDFNGRYYARKVHVARKGASPRSKASGEK